MKTVQSALSFLVVVALAPSAFIHAYIQEYSGKMRVENMAPEGGTCLTPVWVGIHNGTFDTYDAGAQASSSLEALAEEGVVLPLVRDFNRDVGKIWDGVIGSGPICPGETTKIDFRVAFLPGEPLYLSYASMVIPSNDAFIANGNPMEHQIFTAGGYPAFDDHKLKIRVYGDEVLDAGTELNDEIPENTAFLEQTVPNTGVSTVTGGVVGPHPGFKPKGSGGILDNESFPNADFTEDGYKMMRIVVIFDD